MAHPGGRPTDYITIKKIARDTKILCDKDECKNPRYKASSLRQCLQMTVEFYGYKTLKDARNASR